MVVQHLIFESLVDIKFTGDFFLLDVFEIRLYCLNIMKNKDTKLHKPSEKTLATQKLFLAEYNACRWNVSAACKKIGIERKTYYLWLEQPEFAEKIAAAKEATIDWVEQQLFRQMEENSAACSIFFLKCKGKKRGYIEKEPEVVKKDEINWSEVGDAFAKAASAIATKKPEK